MNRMSEEDLLLIQAYKNAADELAAAIKGLGEADLDLSRAPGKWSIREIVHH